MGSSRREVLKSLSVASAGFTGWTPNVVDLLCPPETDGIADQFFDELRDESERSTRTTLEECATEICERVNEYEKSIDEIIDDETAARGSAALADSNRQINRLQKLLEILNDQHITSVVEPSDLDDAKNTTRRATQFYPLLGAGKNLYEAGCEVVETSRYDDNYEKVIEDFLYAIIVFGIEVYFWKTNVAYELSWEGTQKLSNQTLLRYSNHGCDRCIALLMSEIHWALRDLPTDVIPEETPRDFGSFAEEQLTNIQDLDEFDLVSPSSLEKFEIEAEVLEEAVYEVHEENSFLAGRVCEWIR